MKLRLNYVSNSSSASYILPDFFLLPKEKINFIREYDIGALKVWHDHGLEFEADGDGSIHLSLFGIDSPLDFGIVDASDCWYFDGQSDGSCKVHTAMDNFDMRAWLEYNGVKYKVEYED